MLIIPKRIDPQKLGHKNMDNFLLKSNFELSGTGKTSNKFYRQTASTAKKT